MTEYSKFISELFDSSRYVDVIIEDMEPLGYCTVGTPGYQVHLSSSLDPTARDIIKLHEYGHIDFGHMRADTLVDKGVISEYIQSKGKSDCISDELIHLIINTSMDLEINSKLLSIKDVVVLKKLGIGVCNSTKFGVKPGLPYRDYLIPVTDKLLSDDELMNSLKSSLKNLGNTAQYADPSGIPDPGGHPSDGKPILGKGSEATEGLPDESSDKGAIESKDAEGGKSDKSSGSDDNSGSNDSSGSDKNSEANQIVYQPVSDGFGRGIGTQSTTNKIKVIDAIDKNIIRFLDQILPQPVRSTRPDQVKPLIRKSRGETSILYTARRYKILREDIKLAIIVDISGSMNQKIVSTAVNTICSLSNRINPSSRILLTNTRVESILSIEKNQSIDIGGGTDISKGVIKAGELGFNTILIISDFQTDDDPLEEAIKKYPADYYGISYASNECDSPNSKNY